MAQKVQFQDRLSTALLAAGKRPEFDHHNGHGHGHEHGNAALAHLHDAATGTWTPVEHGHTHEHLENPGKYSERNMPDFSNRDFEERAFTIGIGGPVGSGKTALLLALCRAFRDDFNIAVVTNDIFTKEDQEFLIRNNALEDQGRVRAVETGGCPHAAIREDISANMHALEELQGIYETELLFVESGGDNLAANYSRELADYIIYVIDVSGGDKVPRKGGPGISQSDLLIVNKVSLVYQPCSKYAAANAYCFILLDQIDLAPYVGASLDVMKRDAAMMREGGPTIFASIRHDDGVQEIKEAILGAWKVSGAQGKGRPLGKGKGRA